MQSVRCPATIRPRGCHIPCSPLPTGYLRVNHEWPAPATCDHHAILSAKCVCWQPLDVPVPYI